MIKNYLKIAWRNLFKNRISSLINLVGLTLGLSACIAIYLISSYELSFNKAIPDSERIYRLVGKFGFGDAPGGTAGFVPYALPAAVEEDISGLESVAAFINFESKVTIPNGDQAPKVFAQRNMGQDAANIILTQPAYFDIFHYDWLAGDQATALDKPFQVVLSEKSARKYFGEMPLTEILGKTVIYADSQQMNVAGIVKDWEQPSDLTFTDFISFATIVPGSYFGYINLNEWTDIWSASQAFVKLTPNSTPEQVNAQFPAFAESHFQKPLRFTPHLQPLSELHFDADYGDNYSRKAHLPTLYSLMGVALFILIIAAINFVNLSTAQSFQRAKEVGIRKVLGSSRKTLVSQFLSETLILTVLAAALALLIVPALLDLFKDFIPQGVSFQIDGSTLVFLLVVTVGTTLLAGLYPALALSSFLPALSIKGESNLLGGEKAYLRKALIVFQFAISLVFILGTVLVGRQLNYMRHKDLGFQSDAVVTLHLPRGPFREKTPLLYERIQQLPGVQKAALQIFEPMGQNFGVDKLIYHGTTTQEIGAAYKMGDVNFIPFYEMELLAGRNVMKSDTARELVINESFVTRLGFSGPQEAIDQQLEWRGKYYPIVGVVADFHQLSMHEKIGPTFITTAPWANNIAFKLNSRDAKEAEATLAQVKGLWESIFPEDEKFNYTFLDDTIAQFFEKERKTGKLVNVATLIALLISCLGLYGLSVFTAGRRTKEIGIRKVLGASVSGIVALLSKDFVWLILLASIVAFPLAWYLMQQWLQDFQYRIEIQWWMFAVAVASAVLITLLTVGFQSLKSALTNPVESLRSE